MHPIATIKDKQRVADFLFSLGDELAISERPAADEITDLLFDKGGVFTGTVNGHIVGVIGYFLGDLVDDYADKKVGFIYVAGLALCPPLRQEKNRRGFNVMLYANLIDSVQALLETPRRRQITDLPPLGRPLLTGAYGPLRPDFSNTRARNRARATQ